MIRNFTLAVAAVGLCACSNHDIRGDKNVTLFVPRAAMAALGADVQVVGTHDSGVLITVPADQEAAVKAQAPAGFRFDDWAHENTAYGFESMERKLQEFQRDYPTISTLATYGTSRQGRPEYVMTISKKTSHDVSIVKPEVMITAATHGNEIITVDVALGLMEKLLKGYGVDARITNMLDSHTLYFVPAVCIDSYVAETRENEGRDPNRDYPYPEVPSRNPVGCIRDIMAFADSHQLAGTMDFHSAASMIMFPWAYTYNHIPTADYAKLDALTTRMARTNGFAHGSISETIYVAKGSSADYYYWKKHSMATAIEVSHNFAVEGDNGSDIVTENTESTWLFIESFTP